MTHYTCSFVCQGDSRWLYIKWVVQLLVAANIVVIDAQFALVSNCSVCVLKVSELQYLSTLLCDGDRSLWNLDLCQLLLPALSELIASKYLRYVMSASFYIMLFEEIKDPKHPLHYLLPPVKVSNSQMVLRPTYPYQLPPSKSSRYGRDFIPYCISKKF